MPDATLADDAYHSLAQLFGLLGDDWVITNGVMRALTNGLTWRYGDETTPTTTTTGDPIAASSGVTFGPNEVWHLDRLWIRNTTAGSNATVMVNASIVRAERIRRR